MYILPDFVDSAVDGEWKSKMHRLIAINLLTCNSSITKMDDLKFWCNEINKLTEAQARTMTMEDALKLGIPGI